MPVDFTYDKYVAQAVVVVGTSAANLATAVGAPGGRQVSVQADPLNAGVIYLGDTTNVTAAPALAHTALKAGDWRVLPINNLTDVWAIATQAGQKLLVGVLA